MLNLQTKEIWDILSPGPVREAWWRLVCCRNDLLPYKWSGDMPVWLATAFEGLTAEELDMAFPLLRKVCVN
jgi:hypothetical protein